MNKPTALKYDSLRRITVVAESLRDETFSFQHEGHTYVWNVTQAWRLVQELPRDPVYFHPAEQGVTVAHLNERYPSLDWEYAKTTDLTRPLLFVPYNGQAQMLDGWHRLGRAVLEGVAELPAYLLTQEEADECLILHLPTHVPWVPGATGDVQPHDDWTRRRLMPPTPRLRKTLDRTFDLSSDGLAACYRIRLFEQNAVPDAPNDAPAERILVTSWDLHQPGLPLDAWMERMADEAFSVLHGQGGPLLLVEFYPSREFRIGENLLTFGEEITMARIQPQSDGTIALLDFGEMARADIEARIGESLTNEMARPDDFLDRTDALASLSERKEAVRHWRHLLHLFLFVLEITPLLIKASIVFHAHRPYDDWLDALDAEAKERAAAFVTEERRNRVTEQMLEEERCRLCHAVEAEALTRVGARETDYTSAVIDDWYARQHEQLRNGGGTIP
jgi:hypothetical protein